MPLDDRQVKHLLDMVIETRVAEIDCDACLKGLAEFAETELVGAELPDALARIDAHLKTCPECAEEYALLRDVVREASPT